ncbi:MAG: hypothetical protein KGS48_03805 [Bacteroidetes bacterium]|nr:hypothetical protein [Bacteroidota bacterium]
MQVTEAIRDIVRQINELLYQFDSDSYARPLPAFDGGTIGQHFRHILEFFQRLEHAKDAPWVDYAARNRNPLYETDAQLTAAAFENFATQLHLFNIQNPILIKAEFLDADRPEFDSSMGRELLFAYDHAIHHLAIIKIGLRMYFPEISIENTLGVSPSTLLARQKA